MEFVRATLAAAGIDKPAPDPHRYTWSTLAPGTRIPSRAQLLMAAIAQRIAWRNEYDRALLAAHYPSGTDDDPGGGPSPQCCSAIGSVTS
ncbi:hypothetical protein ACIHDR_37590 [Nocardia sp. NPDC052278]|uniref:hypothetical protein n=1 Tax=unclassified Nocardia TaxID=2637762 RepID=UPI0036D05AF2